MVMMMRQKVLEKDGVCTPFCQNCGLFLPARPHLRLCIPLSSQKNTSRCFVFPLKRRFDEKLFEKEIDSSLSAEKISHTLLFAVLSLSLFFSESADWFVLWLFLFSDEISFLASFIPEMVKKSRQKIKRPLLPPEVVCLAVSLIWERHRGCRFLKNCGNPPIESSLIPLSVELFFLKDLPDCLLHALRVSP